jgi:hypothetical protein
MSLTLNFAPDEKRSYVRDGVVRPDGKVDRSYATVSQLKSIIEDSWFFSQRDLAYTVRGMYNHRDGEILDEILDNWDNHIALAKIGQRVQRDAGLWDSADAGTRIHEYTELYDLRKMAIWDMPVDVQPVLYNYARLTAGIEWTHVEQRVVNDKLRYVGTLDRIGVIDGESFVFDIKAGLSAHKGLRSTTFQCYGYAVADLYLGTAERLPNPASPTHGYMIWVPHSAEVGEGQIFELNYSTVEDDLVTASQAYRARKRGKINPDQAPVLGSLPWDAAAEIDRCEHVSQLNDVYVIASKRGEWTAALQSRAKARKQEIMNGFTRGALND